MMLEELVKLPEPSGQQTDRMLSTIHGRMGEMARTRARTRHLLAAAAVTTIVGAGAMQVLMKPPDSFASWTAMPEAFGMSTSSAEFARCMSEMPPLPPGVGSVAVAPKPVLAEKRGAFTAALLVDSVTTTLCIHDDKTRGAGRVTRISKTAGESIALEANGGSLDEGDVRYVFGVAADAVDEVVVHLDNGEAVTASLSDGQFLAWWPSGREPVTIEARGGRGTLQQLHLLPTRG